MSDTTTIAPERVDLRNAQSRTAWLQRLATEKLAALLPRHVSPDAMVRVVLAEFTRSPKLAECTPASLAISLLTAAQFGLVPSGPLGNAYLIPRWNRKANATECSLQIGYKGLLQLMRNTGDIARADARVVYEGETFAITAGSNPTIVHEPRGDVSHAADKIVAAYAIIVTKDGGTYFDYVWPDEIEDRRKRGASGQDKSTPWDTDYAAMARKSAIRKLLMGGMVPMSADIALHLHDEDDRERDTIDASADAGPRPRSLAAALAAPQIPEHVQPQTIDAEEPEHADPVSIEDAVARLTAAGKLKAAEEHVKCESGRWDPILARVALEVLS